MLIDLARWLNKKWRESRGQGDAPEPGWAGGSCKGPADILAAPPDETPDGRRGG